MSKSSTIQRLRDVPESEFCRRVVNALYGFGLKAEYNPGRVVAYGLANEIACSGYTFRVYRSRGAAPYIAVNSKVITKKQSAEVAIAAVVDHIVNACRSLDAAYASRASQAEKRAPLVALSQRLSQELHFETRLVEAPDHVYLIPTDLAFPIHLPQDPERCFQAVRLILDACDSINGLITTTKEQVKAIASS